ncbi:MAG: hypothetical protein HKO55_02055 [Gammaproteobacteria bacterium]|nr:hypothetical protein [Gammaproteobacteria bacterium]
MSRNSWWKILALCIVFFLWLFTVSPGHDWGGDFSQYILHAINLAEGRPYADIGYIRNVFSYVGPAAYPPVFPALLAPVYWVSGLDWLAFKAVVIAAFCAALFFATSLQGNKLSAAHQFAIIILLALSPYFWGLKDQVLSDFVFMMICMVMLALLDRRYLKEDVGFRDAQSSNWLFAIPMGLLLYLGFATREIGVVFIPVIVLFELIHFRKVSLVSSAAVVIFLGLAAIQSVSLEIPEADAELSQRVDELGIDQGYGETDIDNSNFFNLDPQRVFAKTLRYGSELGVLWPLADNAFVATAGWTALLLALGFALAGYVRGVLAGPGVLEIFVAGYLLVVVLYGGWQGLRYVVPLVPIFFFYAFVFHGQLLRSQYRKTAIAIATVFIGATSVSYASNYRAYISNHGDGVTSPDAVALFEYIKTSTPEASTFVFQKPRVLALLANRSASGWAGLKSAERLPDYMDAIGAEYLVYSNIDHRRTSHPVVSVSLPDGAFALEYSNERFYLYRRIATKAARLP